MTIYPFNKEPVSLDKLAAEIKASSITIALDHLQLDGTYLLSVIFKADLSTEEQDLLATIVQNHDGIPPVDNFVQKVDVQSQPPQAPFASKVLSNGKKLYKHGAGIQCALNSGANTIEYAIPLPWVKITGVEVIGGEILDYVDFYVVDNAAGSYSGVPNMVLNQYAFSLNIAKDFYHNASNFDADLYQGMVLRCVYHSISQKTVCVNFILNEVK